MRAIICPLRTRVPRSTACSTSRPGTLTPRTTVSSAASAPVDVTVRGTRSSTVWNTLTGRSGAVVGGLSTDAAADTDALGWSVQPAAATTTASRANQGRGIRQMIPLVHERDGADGRAVGAFDAQRQRGTPIRSRLVRYSITVTPAGKNTWCVVHCSGVSFTPGSKIDVRTV